MTCDGGNCSRIVRSQASQEEPHCCISHWLQKIRVTTLFPALPVAKVVFADAYHGVVVALLPVLGDVTVGEPLVAPGSRVLDVVPGGEGGTCRSSSQILLSAPAASELERIVFIFFRDSHAKIFPLVALLLLNKGGGLVVRVAVVAFVLVFGGGRFVGMGSLTSAIRQEVVAIVLVVAQAHRRVLIAHPSQTVLSVLAAKITVSEMETE